MGNCFSVLQHLWKQRAYETSSPSYSSLSENAGIKPQALEPLTPIPKVKNNTINTPEPDLRLLMFSVECELQLPCLKKWMTSIILRPLLHLTVNPNNYTVLYLAYPL